MNNNSFRFTIVARSSFHKNFIGGIKIVYEDHIDMIIEAEKNQIRNL